MRTVLLCGGRGMIDPETRNRMPKGMVKVGDRPLLWHVMNTFATHGHRDFVLALGEGSEHIRNYFLTYGSSWRDIEVSLATRAVKYLDRVDEENWSVKLIDTGIGARTGSRLARCAEYVRGEPFMLTYSDCLCNVNINALIEFHRAQGKVATITAVRPPFRFGTFHVKDGRIEGYSMQATLVSQGGYINGGYMVFEPRIFDYIDPFSECVLEAEVFGRLAQESQVAIFQHDGYWQPVDSERDVLGLNEQYRKNMRPWLPEPDQLK